MNKNQADDPHYAITFLRHGESIANAKGIRQGQTDFPLTELGKHQVRSLTERWKDEMVSFNKIISSPLSRARQTCEIIIDTLKIPINYDYLWAERDNGALAGLSVEEASKRYPRPHFINPFEPIGVTGESQWELFIRAGKAVLSLLQNPPGRYLVISHGGLLNMAMYVILGISPQANFQGVHFDFDNTSITKLSYSLNSRRWRVFRLNDRSHLGDELEDPIDLEDERLTHRFLLIRHAESQANFEKRLQGQVDYDLTSKGREQAHRIAKFLKSQNYKIDGIISSPLKRAKHTATIISNVFATHLELDPIWMEQDFGTLAGRSYEEIANLTSSGDWYEPYHAIGETGESRWELYLRAAEGLRSLLLKPPGTYIIVAHGGILNMLLCALIGITPQTNIPTPGFRFDNTGMTKLVYKPKNHNWILSSINELPPI